MMQISVKHLHYVGHLFKSIYVKYLHCVVHLKTSTYEESIQNIMLVVREANTTS